MDDRAAFMELALSNTQGELSPLEIGIHALKAVPKEQGKKGGGLKSYAERIGKSKSYVTELVNAAEVVELVRPAEQVSKLIDKAKHLTAIHGLPRECWRAACEWLAEHEASVADVEKNVQQAEEYREQYSVTDEWKSYLKSKARGE
jgi:hypothetical protein